MNATDGRASASEDSPSPGARRRDEGASATETPPLSPGLTYVEGGDRGAVHRLVLGTGPGGRASDGGEVLWVDAGGAASTYALTERVPSERALRGLRVARAFTAHQHHRLVRDAVGAASGRTGLVVAPNVAALYEAADAPAAEVDRLFESAVALLADLAEALAAPVLVSAPRASEERRATVREVASQTVECHDTDLGYRFATEEFETTGYWRRGWWQTTIPYWVDLYGAVAVDERAPVAGPAPEAVAAE